MSKFIDMTGWVMSEHGVLDSHWTVVEQVKHKPGKHTMWRCRCDCVDKTEQIIDGCSLRKGTSKQCVKCAHKITGKHNSTHKETETRLYDIWCSMKRRCNNPTDNAYPRYGGRGITVCDEWNSSYENFRDWANTNGYEAYLSIDRINNDGDYCPSNCKWSTDTEQANNRRNNRLVVFNNEMHTLAEWARILGISRTTLADRIDKHHWSIEKAFTTPKKSNNKNKEEQI